MKHSNSWVIIVVPLVIILICVVLNKYSPNEIIAGRYLPPSTTYLFGTDYLGRDLFARTLAATISAIVVVSIATLSSLGIGTLFGAYSGYHGGTVRRVMNAILNIIDSIPDFLLAIALLLLFSNIPQIGSDLGMVITIIIISWTGVARVVTNETSKAMQRGFIAYARNKGAGWRHILTFHLLPSMKEMLVMIGIQRVPVVVLLSAFLGFIGIGFQPPEANLGKMISDGILVFRNHPNVLLCPTIFLVLITLTFGIYGFLLSDQHHATE